MKLDTIYKTTASGKIQEWTVEVEDNKYRTISGQTDGKKITSEWTVCSGKNIGKINETTPEQQALAEAFALRKKKLEKDYMETLCTVNDSAYVQPMLAHKFKDYEDKLTYPVFFQPKLDGIRCLNQKSGLFTRNGKSIVSVPHIHNVKLFDSLSVIFDGELYNHVFKEDFNKITSLVKKTKPTKEDLEESKQFMEYWVYDIVAPDLVFEERNRILSKLFEEHKLDGWKLVPTFKCLNRSELDERYGEALQDGYEGGIIRTNDVYQNKRSKFLLKRKEFEDDEFPILDIVEGKGNRSGTAGNIISVTKDGVSVKAGLRGTREFVRELLDNKLCYINKTVTIRYFGYTPDGSLRFPVAIKFSREDYE